MGLRRGYFGYMFEEDTAGKNGREVKGTVYWTVNLERGRKRTTLNALLKPWNTRGYKIGFLLRANQTIHELVYGGVDLRLVTPQRPEASDLAETYGVPSGHKWVVWGGSGQRDARKISPNTVTFSVRMRLSPVGAKPQVVPVASRHLDGKFTASMPGLWTIGRRRPRARAR
jgi:hypothetical protein